MNNSTSTFKHSIPLATGFQNIMEAATSARNFKLNIRIRNMNKRRTYLS